MAQPIIEVIRSIELTIYRVSSFPALHSIELLRTMQRLELLYAFIMDFFWCVKVLQRIRLFTWPQLFNHNLFVFLIKNLMISEFSQVWRCYSLLLFLLYDLLLQFDEPGLSCILSKAFHYSDKNYNISFNRRIRTKSIALLLALKLLHDPSLLICYLLKHFQLLDLLLFWNISLHCFRLLCLLILLGDFIEEVAQSVRFILQGC